MRVASLATLPCGCTRVCVCVYSNVRLCECNSNSNLVINDIQHYNIKTDVCGIVVRYQGIGKNRIDRRDRLIVYYDKSNTCYVNNGVGL